MKKIIYLLAGILVVSNVIWGGILITSNADRGKSNSEVQFYTLDGTGQKWDVKDYKIIITPTKIVRGHGALTYKGEPGQVENSAFYKIEIQERDIDGGYESVYANEASSFGGPVNILENLKDIGSITSEYANHEQQKDRQNYESTILTITWSDNNGEIHSETIDLQIGNEIDLSNKAQNQK